MTTHTVGSLVRLFLVDYLPQQKGLRSSTIRSYRDTIKMFLLAVAENESCGVSDLQLEQLTHSRVLDFLRDLEHVRNNSISTRNQRLAALHSFFEYVARNVPEILHACGQIAAVPMKRTPIPETHFLTRDEIQEVFSALPQRGRYALRDRTLLIFMYNTGARVQEVADLRVGNLNLDPPASVHLHGKGGKWRSCPLWAESATSLQKMLDEQGSHDPMASVFTSAGGKALTRFGIYTLVRKHTSMVENRRPSRQTRRITPHVLRHSTAVHLLESGVELNVIRGWLGHVSIDTTSRYAEITARMREDALKLCEPLPEGPRQNPSWRQDSNLITWLESL